MKLTYVVLAGFCLYLQTARSLADSAETTELNDSRTNVIQHPNDAAAQKDHATLCLKEHLEAEATMAANAARTLAPDDAEANRLYVTALARDGKYQEAIDAQNNSKMLVDDKTKKIVDAATLALKSQELLQQATDDGKPEDIAGAATQLADAVELDPNNLSIRLTLGWVYLDKLGRPQAAYPHLEVAARYHPQDLNARRLFASACVQTGHLQKAVDEFRAASLLLPGDPWIRANLGRTLAKLGHYHEAEQIYADVLASDPGNADARLGQAELAAWRGHSTEAREILDGLLKENPQNVEALELRADIHRWNWQLTEAQMDYQSVLDLAKDHAGAKSGLEETRRMESSDITVNGYEFTDNTGFRRLSGGAGTRIHLTDHAYLHAGATGWQFHQGGVGHLNRIDGMGALENHWNRWLETSIEGDAFDYEHRKTFGGGQGSFKLSPTPQSDIYGSVAYNQPFVSSIATVTNALRQESVGAGLDLRMGRRVSFQNSFQAARISDDNEWLEETPKLSFRLFGSTYLRAEYDFLTYKNFNPGYWTPFHRHTLGPVLDTSIPLGKFLHLNFQGKLPYIFSESEFGYQLTGGATLDISRYLHITGSYVDSSMPGDQGAWSGKGWQAALQLIF